MKPAIEQIFSKLIADFDGKENRQDLRTILKSYAECSVNPEGKEEAKYLVLSRKTAIDFDRLTEWFYPVKKTQSADALSFSDNYIYLIEFKSGNQLAHQTQKNRLVVNVGGKLNDSAETFLEKICADPASGECQIPFFRFYLVLKASSMNILPLAGALSNLSMIENRDVSPNEKLLFESILPKLREQTQYPEFYDEIDIWYAELFDQYLMKYGIKDVRDYYRSCT